MAVIAHRMAEESLNFIVDLTEDTISGKIFKNWKSFLAKQTVVFHPLYV